MITSIKNYKAVNFDLDTNQMLLTLGSKTAGYDKLKKSFKKVGFIHRQGSGYISKKPLSNMEMTGVLRKIAKNNPWLGACLNKMDVTEITDMFDVSSFVKAESKKQAAQDKRKQKANAQAAVSQGSGKPAPKNAATAPKSAPKTKKSPAKQMTTQKMIGKGFSL